MIRRCAVLLSSVAMAALPLATMAASPPQTLGRVLQWRSVGPAVGGRVVALAGIPGRHVFYMGAVDGGIWKSTDYGVQWKNISDGTLPGDSNSIGAIAVAPSNPDVIYAGTGESDIRGTMITGDGVYKSTDAGKTWHYAGLRDTHTISAIVIDPHDPNVVYASSMGHVFKSNADRGVFKSTDGGATWRKVLFVNAATGAIGLAMDNKNPNVLYAAMYQAQRTPWSLISGGAGSGLYKSTDGGAHWSNLSHAPGFPKGVLGRMGVSVAQSSPNVVYAIVQAKHGGVFRSANAGASWTRVNAAWKLRQRAFYYMSIFADPSNANTVYVPEVDGLFVSRDGGRKYTVLHTPHGDNHIVWIDPANPRILLEGNDGGATVSSDGGKTWSGEHNQMTGQFYHVSLDDRFPYHIYGAQQDEGSMEGPSATANGMIPSADWKNVAYGESTFVAPQPGNPDITYGAGYFSILMRYDMRTGQYQEVSPWPYYQEGAASNELKYRFAWTHPIVFSPVHPRQLFVASQYVLESSDYGATWKRLSPDLTRNNPRTELPSGGPIDLDQSSAEVYPDVSALAISPRNGSLIWAGSADGLVHVTTDFGAHWKTVTPPQLPQPAEISSIEPSATAEGTAYLTAQRYMLDDFHPYVYKTTDYGAHWTPMVSGLPADQYVFKITEDPQNPGLLFAGTKSSVYASFDAGATWSPLALNLPPVQVRDIAIDRRQGQVVIATHGRAFWVLDNLSLLEQLARNPVNASAPRLFAPQAAWLTHAYGSSPYAKRIPAIGMNPPFGATVFFNLPEKPRAPVTLTFSGTQGAAVRSVTLPAKDLKAGMNVYQWNLRYPNAAEVTGYKPPVAAGGLDDTVQGPEVTPGRYTVTLTDGKQTRTQPFSVALDPRIHAGASALHARLALQLRIHSLLDSLDRSIDGAIAERAALEKAMRTGRGARVQRQSAVNGLTGAIDAVVQTQIASSEGSLLHETKLRDHLAYLAADVGLAYAKPTAAEYQVFDALSAKVAKAQSALAAAMLQAKRLASR